MSISQKSVKILWAAAGGRCAFPGCWERLCYHEAKEVAPYILGEMAHICGEQPTSNRHDANQSQAQRDSYQNLILMCPTHHTLIDRKENESRYPADALLQMKADHEARVLERMNRDNSLTAMELARAILPMLEENRQSWAQYGPMSDLAHEQPHNEAAFAVWVSERLSVIVPNNRKIMGLLRENQTLLKPDEQKVAVAFLVHARSYENWVEDRIPYAAVKRFPVEFDVLIRRLADGGA